MTDAGLRYIVEANDRDLRELKRSVHATNRALGGTAVAGASASRGMAMLSKTGALAGATLRAVGRAARLAVYGLAAAAGVGLYATIKAGTKELAEQARVGAQTNAVLKSTGQVAGITKQHIVDLAQAMMMKTGIDDEAIQATENLLLGFTNVRNEVGKGRDIFDRATKAIYDYSVRTGKNALPMTIALGKALQYPEKGYTALGRAGIKFTDAQVTTIKAMVKAGNTAGAQALILAELEKRYKGAAEAAGGTLPGRLQRLREMFNNLAGEVTKSLLPSFEKAVAWTLEHWPEITATFKAVFHGIGVAWTTVLKPTIEALIAAVRFVVDWIRANWPQISATTLAVFNKTREIVMGAVAVITAIWRRFGDDIVRQLRATWEFVQSYIGGALRVIQGIINVVMGLIRGDWDRVWKGLGQIFSGVWTMITALARFALETLRTLISVGLKLILALWKAEWALFVRIVSGVWNLVVGAIRGAIGLVTGAARALGEAILNGLRGGLAAIGSVMQAAAQKLWAAIAHAAASAWSYAAEIGRRIVDGIKGGFAAAWEGVKGFFESKIKGLLNTLNPFSPVEHGGEIYIGRPIAEGAIRGWILGSAPLPEKMSETLRNAIEHARGVIENLRGKFASAWGTLGDDALRAFDAIAGGLKTKSEKLLEQMDLDRRVRDIKERIGAAKLELDEARKALAAGPVDARSQLSEFEAGMAGAIDAGELTPEQAKLKYAELVAAVATEEKRLRDAVTTSRRTLDDALDEQTRFRLEQRAEKERLQLDARIALQRRHFAEALTVLQNHFTKAGEKHDDAQKAILKLLDRHGIDYKTSGRALGNAFAAGLSESIGDVVAAAEAIANAAAQRLKLKSPAEKGPLADLDRWWEEFAPTLTAGLKTPRVTMAVDRQLAAPTPASAAGAAARDRATAADAATAPLQIGTVVVRREEDIHSLAALLSNAAALRS